MEQRRLAPLVGILGCLSVLLALVYPYLVTGGVSFYYSASAVDPRVAGLLALVTTIVFAAGRENRSDPQFAAGAALVFSLFAVAILAAWGTTARVDAVQVPGFHRWLVVGLGLIAPFAAAWYVHALGLVSGSPAR